MTAYLIFPDYQSAHSRADAEGMAQGLPYHYCCPAEITRYVSTPRETASGQWALDVTGYDLTTEEQAATVTAVEWPEAEGADE